MSEEVKNKILNTIKQSKEQSKGGKKYGKEKYLITQLPENEQNGKKRIRILPPSKEDESPISTVYYHQLYVNKYFMRLYDPEMNDGEESPLNRVRRELYNNGDKESRDLAKQYIPRLHYILKVIDRDNEQDGPKFWRFPLNKNGEGVMDKLEVIIEENFDITDVYNGRDLILDLSKNNKGVTKITNIRAGDPSKLSDDDNKIQEWVNDPVSWKDVYRKHPYEYLEIVASGHTPIYDKAKGTFVSKELQEEKEKEDQQEQAVVDTKPSSDATDTSNVLKTKKEQEESDSKTSEESEQSNDGIESDSAQNNNSDIETTNTKENSNDFADEPVDEDLPF